ncbi:MAG: carbonic anhydrase family protein [Planctomycetes bacterium]|nr:carbonic anhydrase family protein [Planctomycetota bacterium]
MLKSRSRVFTTPLLLAVIGILPLAGCGTSGPSSGADSHGTHGGSSHADVHWSYDGDTGPGHWGTLKEEWALCGSGRQQSPIDITETASQDLANIVFHYTATAGEIVNNGHTVQIDFPPGNWIEISGTRFELLQFHFHSPSEHTIAGKEAAAEVHLVHKSAGGELAVVGVLLQSGAAHPGYGKVLAQMPSAAGPAVALAAPLNPADLLPADPRTYRYTGSLTTPPGTEGVRWNLMTEAVELSPAQLGTFQALYPNNRRPVQGLDGREVVKDVTK